MLVASCSTQETPIQNDVVFYASFEQPAEDGTRVYVNEDLHLRWTAEDLVSIFNKNTVNQRYMFTGTTGDSSGEFKKVGSDNVANGKTISHVFSVYPYFESTEISEDEVLSVYLPEFQDYAGNTFGLYENTMISVSPDNSLQYMNVCGYLIVKLYGEGIQVSSITLKGNSGEKLAGKATVSMQLDGFPAVTLSDMAKTEITLRCGRPVQIGVNPEESTEFWFVVPPMTFLNGFAISIVDEKGRVFEKSTDKTVSIRRNKLSRMASLEVDSSSMQLRNNVIYYTTTDGNIIDPINLSDFQGELISNEYGYSDEFHDDWGFLTFNENVTNIPFCAFQDCTTLTCMKLPESLKTIGYSAFSGCSNLSEINIPEGITSIEYGTFWSCSSLTNMVIPEGVTEIRSSAFYNCTALFSISLPKSLTSIGDSAFGLCERLTDVILPEQLTTLEPFAFYECTNLTSITLPLNLTSIGSFAFSGCSGLTSISVLPKTPPTGNSHMFTGTNNCPIIVPTESIEDYLSAPYWRDYADRIQPLSTIPVESITLNKTELELNIGETESLNATLYPGYASNQNVSWSSSNEFVATVSSSGEVKGIKAGSATVTVTSEDGGKTASCNVTILPYYSSTDYSKDGEVVQLQQATVGRGINIIFLGDGFLDKDMNDGGLFDQRMNQAMELFFAYEPYTSFRNRFNVYAVRVVSKNAAFDQYSERTLSYCEGGRFYLRTSVCFEYGNLVPNPNNQPLNIAVICNTDHRIGRSFCSWDLSGRACCFILDDPVDVLNHELGGHGFAYLRDEYIEYTTAYTDFDALDGEYYVLGMGANVDWRHDPSTVRWSRLLSDSRYSEEGIGIFEGALYAYGLYRSTENSMMGNHYLPTGKAFNAPSREQIYKMIMKYSEGPDWQYDFETFVYYDAAGRKQAKEAFSKKKGSSSSRMAPSREQHDHIPPIVIDQDVKAVGVDVNGKVHLVR